MLTLAEIRKQTDGLEFDQKLDLKETLMARNPEIISVDKIQAKGLATFDDELYLLHYQLTYDIVLPSSRSMEPVTLHQGQTVDEVFVSADQLTNKKELIEQNLALVIDGDAIDLAESVADNILLAIPLRVLTEEEQELDVMPSGNSWSVMTEEQYSEQQAQKKKETNPFSALDGLFED